MGGGGNTAGCFANETGTKKWAPLPVNMERGKHMIILLPKQNMFLYFYNAMKHLVTAALATLLVCWQCFRQHATLSWASSYANCISIPQPNQLGFHQHGMLISLATHSFPPPPFLLPFLTSMASHFYQ